MVSRLVMVSRYGASGERIVGTAVIRICVPLLSVPGAGPRVECPLPGPAER